jgi:hypothetical protein
LQFRRKLVGSSLEIGDMVAVDSPRGGHVSREDEIRALIESLSLEELVRIDAALEGD